MSHLDLLAAMNDAERLPAKLEALLAGIRTHHPLVERVAVALFDPATDRLRAAYHATVGGTPLPFYEAELAHVPGLAAIQRGLVPRVIQDLAAVTSERRHTLALLNAGFRASYTLPLVWQGQFEGFVFFDSRTPECLTPELLDQLDVAGRLAAALVLADLQASRTLLAAVRGATRLVHFRDPETGGHLQRMAHFSRLIAVDLTARGIHLLDEQTVEHLFAFAPMHDLGKLGIPDEVLFKPGPLDEAEFTVMRRHPSLGKQMVDALLDEFGLTHLGDADMLRQITEGHHEKLDGSGYPEGAKGIAIPLAARIIAVADVFDALTSVRPYKNAWNNQDALTHLWREAGRHLDPACVGALADHGEDLMRIQERFRDP